jgi:glycosyltransferase involved in cell wall biosynthesis
VTRVVHVSVVHRPDDPRIGERECRSLAEAGYEVCYLAPGAPATRDRYGVLFRPLPERPRSRRWLDAREVLAAVRTLRPDVVHVHDPELLTLFPVLRRSVPRLVYDMHEYVPEQVAAKHYIPAALRPSAARATAVAQRSLAALAAGAITVTEQQFEALGERPRLRLALPNYPRVERFTGAEPLPDLAADPRLKIAYVGSLRRDRGCALMLDVMEQLDADKAVLYLGGVFADPAMEAEARQRLAAGLHDRVKLLGRVPPAELPQYLTAADVVWVPSLPSRQHDNPTVPTKLFEGMASGLAALVSNLPGRGEIVRLEECGLAVPAGAEGHLRGVRRLLANREQVVDMGLRGRDAVERRYSWEALASDLVDFYGSLCAGLPSAAGSRDDQGVTVP